MSVVGHPDGAGRGVPRDRRVWALRCGLLGVSGPRWVSGEDRGKPRISISHRCVHMANRHFAAYLAAK
jgi:hypothetical protein